jgi:hypothetical protein
MSDQTTESVVSLNSRLEILSGTQKYSKSLILVGFLWNWTRQKTGETPKWEEKRLKNGEIGLNF